MAVPAKWLVLASFLFACRYCVANRIFQTLLANSAALKLATSPDGIYAAYIWFSASDKWECNLGWGDDYTKAYKALFLQEGYKSDNCVLRVDQRTRTVILATSLGSRLVSALNDSQVQNEEYLVLKITNQADIVFDFDSQSTPPPLPPPPPPPAAAADTENSTVHSQGKSKLSVGGIVGVVIAALAALGIAGVTFCKCKGTAGTAIFSCCYIKGTGG